MIRLILLASIFVLINAENYSIQGRIKCASGVRLPKGEQVFVHQSIATWSGPHPVNGDFNEKLFTIMNAAGKFSVDLEKLHLLENEEIERNHLVFHYEGAKCGKGNEWHSRNVKLGERQDDKDVGEVVLWNHTRSIICTDRMDCQRCKRQTYFNDRIGPLNFRTFYHRGCFKCWICGSRLTLKSYCNNRVDSQDREVYCQNHVPTPAPHDAIPHRSVLVRSMKEILR